MTITQQRQYSRAAAYLLLLLFVLSTGYNFFRRAGMWDPAVMPGVRAVVVGMQVLSLVLYWGIWRNYRWAKLVYLVSQAFALYFIYRQYSSEGLHLTPLLSFLALLLQQVLALVVTVLVVMSLRRPEAATVGESQGQYYAI